MSQSLKSLVELGEMFDLAEINNIDDALEEGREDAKTRHAAQQLAEKYVPTVDEEGNPIKLTSRDERIRAQIAENVMESLKPDAKDVITRVTEERRAQANERQATRERALATGMVEMVVKHLGQWRSVNSDGEVEYNDCNHEVVHLISPMIASRATLRERERQTLAQRCCTDCWRKQLAGDLDKWEFSVSPSPLLSGSAKQIDFARNTRHRAIMAFEDLSAGFRDDAEVAEIWKGYIDRALASDDVKVWCDVAYLLPNKGMTQDGTILAVCTVADYYSMDHDLAPLPELYK